MTRGAIDLLAFLSRVCLAILLVLGFGYSQVRGERAALLDPILGSRENDLPKLTSNEFNPDPGGVSDIDLTPVLPPKDRENRPAQSPSPKRSPAKESSALPSEPAQAATVPTPSPFASDVFGESTERETKKELEPSTIPSAPPAIEMELPLPEGPTPSQVSEPQLFTPIPYAGQNEPAPALPGSIDEIYRWKHNFPAPQYSLGRERQGLPPNTETRPDRWRLGFEPWRRYDDTRIESTYQKASAPLWHPYRQSLLKGDLPLLGQDIFLSLTAALQTTIESRRLPTPSGISGARPDNAEFYGRGEQFFIKNDVSFIAEVFKGETAFKPMSWAVRIQGVYNANYLFSRETGVVSPDPRGPIRSVPNTNLDPIERDNIGMVDNAFVQNPPDVLRLLRGRISPKPGTGNTAPGDLGRIGSHDNTQRFDDFFALQQAFLELHFTDFTTTYDFISSRVGLQQFISDFRGFIFNETNLGLRIFGNFDNNRWQANLVAFDMREKDTNSELNTFESRHQYVFGANVYRQDTIWPGYTTQLSCFVNLDDSSVHYDRNGFIVRPAPIGLVEPHDVNAFYLGFNGDGHIGWLNITHSFYQVFGRDQLNGIAGKQVDINAQMAALELSLDKDWIRYRISGFYASGDSDATDSYATGFDAIIDNPFFLGSPFSYWARQGFNLGGTAVALKQRDSLLPNLRTSKTEGQSNFVNPGLMSVGVGADLEITPRFRAVLQANYFRFVDTDSIKRALLTDKVDTEIGFDLSVGVVYRPLLTNNIVISAGVGVLIPGHGLRDIYRTTTRPVPGFKFASEDPGDISGDFLYSAILVVSLTY